MRLKAEFYIDSKAIPLDYRRLFLSYFKKALENYDEVVKEKYYKDKDTIMKKITFSVFLNNPKFTRDAINIGSKIVILNFSTSCSETGKEYYNALVNMLNNIYVYTQINVRLIRISIVDEDEITSESINARILSPILVRKHDKSSNLDKYFKPDEPEYLEQLKHSIKSRINKELAQHVDSLIITESNTKEVKVFFYGHKVCGIVGNIKLKGNSKVLDFIIKSGLGSRTSSGFGMLQII